MNISYVTIDNATDINKWSGSVYYISQSLKNQSLSVEYISCLRKNFLLQTKAKEFFYRRLFHKNYLQHREPVVLKDYARQVQKRLSSTNTDIVFSPGTVPIAYLECNQPIVFWTDASFAGMINYYPEFSNLCEESIKNGYFMEQSALERCKLAIYSSEWAAKTAIDNYNVDNKKVKVVPFGANIECNRNINDIKAIVDLRSTNKCKLLFLGVEWFRKGGNVAFQVAKQLNELGLNTELTIVGCEPILDEELPDYVKCLGFISKSKPEGKDQINKLLAESHFLIVPSQAECYGVVFCEANSFGVPCVATNTGGISTIISNDVNGRLFDINADITEYSKYIYNLFVNYSEYKKLAISAFDQYQSRLNWEVAGKTVKQLLMELL